MPFFGKKNYSSVRVRKRDMPDGLWRKCPSCAEMVFRREIESALHCCPKCRFHFPLSRRERIALLADEGSFSEWFGGMASRDPLLFKGRESYLDKLEENRTKTGYDEAVSCGAAELQGLPLALGVMDFNFLGASMGSVVGEKVTRMFERATAESLPAVMICASGGARMYEGMYSLLQMAKTSAALARHAQAGLPYIAVLTHPTMAGVMASFATLGDVILAEPGALIGFAGPRVIKETTRGDLPEGFQRSEFLLEHGLIDRVVDRTELKDTLGLLLGYLGGKPGRSAPRAE